MDGVIVLNKRAGMTSNDCVVKARRILQEKKIGHTGTLDPNVTGVLPLCLGKYTKLSNCLMADNKTYVAEIIFGIKTHTADITGDIIEKKAVNELSEKTLDETLQSFVGTSYQTPPMYSAIKHEGKKLYEYARKGIEVEREKRQITIASIKRLTDIIYINDCAHVKIEVNCSKGTYIRVLAVDIGSSLNIPSTMGNMCRTQSGVFSIEKSFTLDDLAIGNYQILSLADLFPKAKKYYASEYLSKLVLNGIQLDERQIITNEPFLVYDNNSNLIALYEGNEKHLYSPIVILGS